VDEVDGRVVVALVDVQNVGPVRQVALAVDLEQALRLFEEGITHLRSAGAALKTVDARVQQLVEAADGSFSVVELGG
jgi:hypothetical protein